MAAGSNAVAAEPNERILVIERIFDAPRELVFKCWTEPEYLSRWIGPRGFRNTILTWELREGGQYRIHKRGPDGQDLWQQGVFREIIPPERIVRTYCWTDASGTLTSPEMLLTLTFAEMGGRTRLTLHQAVFESVTARDDHERGWSSSLDQLAEYLAAV
jgi:uncharacterized protein YndB with AHSA1/START domain